MADFTAAPSPPLVFPAPNLIEMDFAASGVTLEKLHLSYLFILFSFACRCHSILTVQTPQTVRHQAIYDPAAQEAAAGCKERNFMVYTQFVSDKSFLDLRIFVGKLSVSSWEVADVVPTQEPTLQEHMAQRSKPGFQSSPLRLSPSSCGQSPLQPGPDVHTQS